MSNRLSKLLSYWKPHKDELEWVLGTVIETKGPTYRKTGAMMLISSLGQWHGLLSGGCLEADLMRHAQQVMHSNKSKIVCYNAHREDELPWLLGIGCGGMVRILLQTIRHDNQYLYLDEVLQALKSGHNGYYLQTLREEHNHHNAFYIDEQKYYGDWNSSLRLSVHKLIDKRSIYADPDHTMLFTHIQTDPNIVIFGGGEDTLPLINLAHELGWHTHLVDHRSAYARPSQFKKADHIYKISPEQCLNKGWLHQCDAAIVMNHNIELDAKSLLCLRNCTNLRYIGLLGPTTRKEKVLIQARINENELPTKLYGPIGFDIGGELPESIALSALAQIHSIIEHGNINLPLHASENLCEA